MKKIEILEKYNFNYISDDVIKFVIKINNGIDRLENNKKIEMEIIENITKLEKHNRELGNLKKELEIYEMLHKISGRDGIQLYLLKTYLGTINDRIKIRR